MALSIRIFTVLFASLQLSCGSFDNGGSNTPEPVTHDPGSQPDPEPVPDLVQLTLDVGTRYQTLEGFGASLAWYGDSLLHHPQAETLQEIVFADLGLDILRLRNRYQRTNENVDVGDEQALVAAATESLGYQPKLLMTSWSPPAELKANNDDDCLGNSDCTLKKVNGNFVYDAFGQFWRDSLEHYHELGIVPDWISIQNEPGFIPNGWEGNKLTATEGEYPAYGIALAAVDNALTNLANRPGLLGPENLGVHYNIAATYLRNLDKSLLAGVAHHLYERGNDGIWDWRDPGPDSYVEPMQTVVEEAGDLPIFMTEFQTDEDQGFDGGFETASLIHNSLVHANHAAWLYWDLVWENNSGLVSVTDNDYRIRDQYYALRHYSLFTDPGYQRLAVSSSDEDILASAFIAPDESRITLVVLNTGAGERTFCVDTAGANYSQSQGYVTVYDPGNSSTWIPVNGLGEDLSVVMPPRSQVTLVLE